MLFVYVKLLSCHCVCLFLFCISLCICEDRLGACKKLWVMMRRQFVNVKQQSWSGGRAKVGVGLEQIRSCHHVRWSIDQIIRCSDDQLDNQMIKLSDDQEAAQRLKWDWNRSDPVIASDDQFIRWSTYQMIKHSDDQMVNWSGNHIIRWSSNQMTG